MSTAGTGTGTAVTIQLNAQTRKRYTLLSALPTGNGPGKIQITKCSAMLDNHMQCWRAGDFLVEQLVPSPDPDSATSEVVQSSYQKCRAHAQQERDQDEVLIKNNTAAQAQAALAEVQGEQLPAIETRAQVQEGIQQPTVSTVNTTQTAQTVQLQKMSNTQK